MKSKDKYYLKALLLASISTIGMPIAQATGTSGAIVRKEREGNDASTELVSKTLSSGVLDSHPSFGEVLGHSSHSSHSSHGSHGSHTSSSHGSHSSHTSSSHTSHVSSGYDSGSGGSGNSTTIALTALGGLAGTVGLMYLINHIIKKHKKHVALRKADINRHHAYASRDLSNGVYGNDVDLMTDLLIENGVLKQYDRKFSRKWSHYKYNRKVKRSVKRMQARMGQERTGKASRNFQMGLKQWRETRRELAKAAAIDSLDLMKDRHALHAVAILLVEKGLLKSYDVDNIMSEQEKSKILEAYHDFLRSNHLQETSLIDEQKLRLLISLPNKHNEVI